MSDQKSVSIDQDRREFFRLDDQVNLSHRVISEDELPKGVGDIAYGPSDGLSVMTRLTHISHQLTATLHRIDQQNPDLADYLRALDEKMEILAQTFLSQSNGLIEQPTQRVNLSAGGIAFVTETSYQLETVLEIQMLLFPSYSGIMAYGRVVSSDPSEEGDGYQTRIDFECIRDSDRDALIRHILRRQGEYLRQMREEREAE